MENMMVMPVQPMSQPMAPVPAQPPVVINTGNADVITDNDIKATAEVGWGDCLKGGAKCGAFFLGAVGVVYGGVSLLAAIANRCSRRD